MLENACVQGFIFLFHPIRDPKGTLNCSKSGTELNCFKYSRYGREFKFWIVLFINSDKIYPQKIYENSLNKIK